MNRSVFALTTAFTMVAGPVLAHPVAGSVSGMAVGFGHPLSGLDHALAMVAVGILAVQSGGRSLWAVPAAFVGMMALGALLGIGGIAVPLVEPGIVGSVVILGVVVAAAGRMPMAAAVGLAGALAVFHGYAHGAEMPAGAGGLAYGAGFVMATALLHAAGMGLAVGARAVGERLAPVAVRVGGGAIAVAGVGLIVL